ncbi:hypothetical protein FQR65_LT19098 [Abscondita terminalis]|nr:hypothetical protein FQR65_LT19098 [Abscondita terminalis]
MENWELVVGYDHTPMTNGNNIVVQHVTTREIGYLENNKENRDLFDINVLSPQSSNAGTSKSCSEDVYIQEDNEDTSSHTFKWSHSLTKFLITERLMKEKEFNRPKCKKSKLWSDIAKDLNYRWKTNFSSQECDTKFRNLLKTLKLTKQQIGIFQYSPVVQRLTLVTHQIVSYSTGRVQ